MSQFNWNVDIVFVLDSSASLTPQDFENAKLFVQEAIIKLDLGSRKVSHYVIPCIMIVFVLSKQVSCPTSEPLPVFLFLQILSQA